MRKCLSMMLIMASFVCLSSCSSDDDNNAPEIPDYKKLYVGDSFELGYKSNWVSTNKFAATVNSNGTVKAERVGNSYINSYDDDLSCYVEIYPSYTLYNDLVTQWGISKERLVSYCGSNYTSSGNLIGYTTNSDITPIIMYGFENGGLYIAAITVKTTYTEELIKHLEQRYKLLAVDTEDYNLYCIDADELSDAETVVIASLYNSNYWFVVYMPNTTSRSALNNKELIDNIKKEFGLNLE